MSPFLFACRDAMRAWRHDRGYASVVVLTLALTIGATTAAFSIVDGVLLSPLRYEEPGRLVAVREVWREVADRAPVLEANGRHFEYWRTHATRFDSMAQYIAIRANLAGPGDAVQIAIVEASGSLFDVLRQRAALGRTLSRADDDEGAADAMVISDGLWRRRFGAAADIIGRTVALDGRAYEVVGVLPAGFRMPDTPRTGQPEAFIAMRLRMGWVGEHNNQVIGRLAPGATIEDARAELDVLQGQVSAIASDIAGEPVTLSTSVVRLTDRIGGPARRGLWLLLTAVAAVLLIACANLANLALTRTFGRLREAAIRTALGASRRQLVTRAVAEQMVLAVTGGALGVLVAWAALRVFVVTAPVDIPRVDEVAVDGRVVAFAGVVSLAAGLIVASVSAWRLARHDVQAGLRATATAVAGDRSGLRSQAVLVTLQVGLTVALLSVTVLLGVSLMRVLAVDPGFTADRVLAIDVALPAASPNTDDTDDTDDADVQVSRARLAVFDRILSSVGSLPGVRAVSTTSLLPLEGQGQVNFVVPDGADLSAAERPTANFRLVAPGFFETVGLAIRSGRTFTSDENAPGRPVPAVISAATAARLWPGTTAIGRRFSRHVDGDTGFEVVGVAADAHTTSLDSDEPLMVYVPYWWQARTTTSLLVRAERDPAALVPEVRRAVREINPAIAVGTARPLTALVERATATRRYQTRIFMVFGLTAVLIAAVGVYAVTAYTVSRRRREMNIRVALGARSAQVLGLLLAEAGRPILAGIGVGIAGAVAGGGLVGSLLFGIDPANLLVIAGVVSLVAALGLGAAALATRRGMALDPAAALRDE